jgi:hypothetical protein
MADCFIPGFGNLFLLADDGATFLTDDGGQVFLIASSGTLPSVNANDSIAYIFQFTDIAAAQADSVVGPLFNVPYLNRQELLVYADLTVNSVTPEPGFWLMIIETGGVRSNMYFHPNIQVCLDLNQINTTNALLGSNLCPTHLGIVIDNYGNNFIQGLPPT